MKRLATQFDEEVANCAKITWCQSMLNQHEDEYGTIQNGEGDVPLWNLYGWIHMFGGHQEEDFFTSLSLI